MFDKLLYLFNDFLNDFVFAPSCFTLEVLFLRWPPALAEVPTDQLFILHFPEAVPALPVEVAIYNAYK